ncbi:MAG: type I-E CRISPR-associated protein Cas6/Cse3/CasE [Candidatus Cloacimonetes bacterium]|nr:type I-E CRISPR-associated protein Cas6/Cse3/CasE [Candidatus Cloacimonadota bacterium]
MNDTQPAYFSLIETDSLTLPPDLFENVQPYFEHQLLWKLFKQQKDREFLFRRIHPQGTRSNIGWYVVSKVKPESGIPGLKVATKIYQPSLSEGQRFRFSIRVNPVITKKIENDKGKRHDLIMDLKQQGNRDLPKAQLERLAAVHWLQKRSENAGFEVREADIFAEGHQVHHFKRLGNGGRIATLDIQGVLTVSDPERFQKILLNGLGPAKSFGCGLMTIARV